MTTATTEVSTEMYAMVHQILSSTNRTAYNSLDTNSTKGVPPVFHADKFDSIMAGVIGLVVLVLILLAVVVLRYRYHHKGSYLTNEAKGTEHAETADAALRGDPSLQEAADENKKEYFI